MDAFKTHEQVIANYRNYLTSFINIVDEHKRNLLIDAGYDVIIWHYAEKLEELVTRRKDIFRKI